MGWRYRSPATLAPVIRIKRGDGGGAVGSAVSNEAKVNFTCWVDAFDKVTSAPARTTQNFTFDPGVVSREASTDSVNSIGPTSKRNARRSQLGDGGLQFRPQFLNHLD